MSTHGRGDTGRFARAYAAALRDYLAEPGEAALREAYELGRQAVRRQLSVLDLADAHQQSLLDALADASGAADARELARAAGDFFLESLSSFEMVQRGFREARATLAQERRQTELWRHLSTFLADVSLALDVSDTLEEMLRLVAEQARELVGGSCCVATVAAEGRPRAVEAVSGPEDDARWAALVRWLDLPAIYRLLRAHGGSVRMGAEQLEGLDLLRRDERPLRGWLAASLTTLDGGEMGALQVFDEDAPFSADDEATLLHLAQMASAAVERARLYRERDAPDA